jgi:transposase
VGVTRELVDTPDRTVVVPLTGACSCGIGLLAHLRGILVHDHWAAYLGLDCLHVFCNAHHLRELIAVTETYPGLAWPQRLIDLLLEANKVTQAARDAGLSALAAATMADLFRRYDAILAEGARYHPHRPGPPGIRRRVEQTPAHKLVTRLQDHRDEVLRFVTDLRLLGLDHNSDHAGAPTA